MAVGDDVSMEYVSRVLAPPLDGLIDDNYYLEGAPPYSRLMLPAAPAPLLIVNLGAPFLIRAGTDGEAVWYVDGRAVTTPTRAWEFGYPTPTRVSSRLQSPRIPLRAVRAERAYTCGVLGFRAGGGRRAYGLRRFTRRRTRGGASLRAVSVTA